MGAWKHRVSELDTSKSTGTCAACGIIDIYVAPGSGQVICGNAKRLKSQKANIRKKGLDPDVVLPYVKEHDSRCEICGDLGELNVDHCHEELVFRGLLCRSCNLGLGYFKDNKEFLLRAIKYLSK